MLRFFALAAVLCATAVGSAAEPKVAERWAVLIGVDDYATANDLNYCGADQTAFRDRLIASGFRPEHIVVLHDKAEQNKHRPSLGNITRQLDLVIGSAEEDDLLVVAFSGHGVSLAGKSYLCPSDATLSDPTTLISLDGVYDRLRNCAARFKWVLVDACRNDPMLGGGRSLTPTEGTRQLAQSLKEIKLPEGVVLLNSCAPGEISWEEPAFGHGVYMHFVLEAMDGKGDTDGDGAVSLNEVQRYASSRTKAHVIDKFNHSQRPFYRSEGEADAMDFALLPIRRDAPLSPTPPLTTNATSMTTPPPVLTTTPPAVAPASIRPVNLITNSIEMKFAFIPAGEFQMGSSVSDYVAEDDEKPQHRARITKSFYLSIHEVTQSQWQAVMGTSPWSGQIFVREGADYPATSVNWDDAVDFCRTLGRKEGKTYRLPTEAEWEYACRAGTTTKYSFGDDDSRLSEYAWYELNAWGVEQKYAHVVGQKRPNAWGLYDMHGNVWEWCEDCYHEKYYQQSPVDDPSGPTADSDPTERVVRGGGWSGSAAKCRSAGRSKDSSTNRLNDGGQGFRVVLVP